MGSVIGMRLGPIDPRMLFVLCEPHRAIRRIDAVSGWSPLLGHTMKWIAGILLVAVVPGAPLGADLVRPVASTPTVSKRTLSGTPLRSVSTVGLSRTCAHGQRQDYWNSETRKAARYPN